MSDMFEIVHLAIIGRLQFWIVKLQFQVAVILEKKDDATKMKTKPNSLWQTLSLDMEDVMHVCS